MFDQFRKDKAIRQVFMYIFLAGIFLIQDKINPGVYEIHSKIDDMIPFTPFFVVGYFLWYIFLAGTGFYFLKNSKIDLYKTFRSLNLCMLVAITIYIAFPNYISLRPDGYSQDFFTQWVKMLQTIDSPSGVCPSLHVATSISLFAGIANSECFRGNRIIKILTFILVFFIIISTVFIKQHSIVDVLFGLLLGIAVYLFVYKFDSR